MSGHNTRQANKQPGAAGSASAPAPTPSPQLTAEQVAAALAGAHGAQAAMDGLAHPNRLNVLLNAAAGATLLAGSRANNGVVGPLNLFALATALKAVLATGSTSTESLTKALANDGPLAYSFDATTTSGFGNFKPTTDGELPQAFTGLTVEQLTVLHDCLQLDRQLAADTGADATAPHTNTTTTQPATHNQQHFVPHVASPLQPTGSDTLQWPAHIPQSGTSLLPPTLDATAARTLSAEHNADVYALYLASSGAAVPGQGLGGAGSGPGGLAGGPGGEHLATTLPKAPALTSFLLDKTDNTAQLVLENGKVALKKETTPYMTQTQFIKAYMALIQTTYSHCTEQATRFFMHLNDCWDKYPFTALMRYERAIRQKCARNPDIALDEIHKHMHEWIEHLGPSVAANSHSVTHRNTHAKQEEPAYKKPRPASPAAHNGSGSRGGSGGSTAARAPGSSSKPPCRDYNGGGCSRAKCGFPHRCTRCNLNLPHGATGADGAPVTRCPVCASK